jgi:hypothetical protein
MPDAYIMRMLAYDFTVLIPTLKIHPLPCSERDLKQRIVHRSLVNRTPDQDVTNNHGILMLLASVQEQRPRGTGINF